MTAAFALGALLLSLLLSILTYEITRSYLVRQRETSAVNQAYVNAQLVRDGLRSERPAVPPLLASLGTGSDTRAVLRHNARWFSTSVGVGRDTLPPALRDRVADGRAARMSFPIEGVPHLAVGLPVPAVTAEYYEVSTLVELDRTLRRLGLLLAGAAAATTLAGAGMGRWASRRLLAPLADAARAAAAIAGGDLEARLEASNDADMAMLTSSFNRMVDALRERIERDARFASDVSHELRSPLTTVSNSLGVMQARRADLPERAQQALDLLAADVERFERLVQDLLEISRYDAGAADLALEDVRFAELVRHAVNASPDRDVPVDLAPGVGKVVVRADKRRLERVIANLLTNARKHGGGAVRVGAASSDGVVRVEVDDAGPGVPADERRQIFERFARGKAAGRRSGSEGVGLGLSLVAEHVRLHGGRVWVEDAPAGGARFVVELPAGTAESSE